MNGFAELAENPSVGSIRDWVEEINQLFARRTVNTLELAGLVLAARRALRHGQWTELWKSGKLPFSRSKGNKLFAIATAFERLNGATLHHLPNAWSILYQLSRLNRAALERLIEQNEIQPALTLGQANALVAQYGIGGGSRRLRVVYRLKKVAEFVSTTSKEWSLEETRNALSIVTEMLRMLSDIQCSPRFERPDRCSDSQQPSRWRNASPNALITPNANPISSS